MSEKKNIDRLFQEKFKDFEADPPEFVWDNLEELLQKKKKRRVVPLWWRMGGIAAAIVVGMLFLYPYFNGNHPGGPDAGNGVVYDSPALQTGTKGGSSNNTQGGKVQPNRSIKSHGPTASPNAVATGKVVEGGNSRSQVSNSEFQIPNSKKQNGAEYADGGTAKKSQKQGKSVTAKGTGQTEMYAHNGAGNKKANPNKGQSPAISTQQQSGLANTQEDSKQENENGGNDNNIIRNAPQYDSQIADTQNPVTDGQTITGVPAERQPKPTQELLPVTPEQGIADVAVDSLKEKEDEFLKFLREEEKNNKQQAVAENESNGDAGKWNIKPQMGPLMYSSLSNGSPIDAQFAANAKSFDNQMSYGLGFNYAVTDRFSVRTGVNTVNLSYATQGVEFYASLNESTNNVARTSDANIVVQNQQNSGTIDPTNAFAMSDQLPKETFNGSMVQRTGYIEVPLEMSYALLDKKFGIDVIGGFSTLFLNENNVSVVSTQGLSTEVGRAQNLNNLSFSTNLGVGFKYRFFKQFEASFEPTFKYQLNTYARNSGNFRPYFIGMYTGISFSF